MPRKTVLIVGGGPVGLALAVALGRAGVPVKLFEQGDVQHQEPRAATIHPASLDQLDDLGVYELIEPQGIICPIVNYYDGKELIASFDHTLLAGEVRHPWVLQCEQDKLARTLFSMACAMPSVEILPLTKLISFSQSADHVRVVVESLAGQRSEHHGEYVVGADGARSLIRKGSGIAFEGETLPGRFMIVGTPHDFVRDGYAYRNYISDPDEWYNLFKISWRGPPGLFRLVVPVSADAADLDEKQRRDFAQAKLQRFHPRPEPYEVTLTDMYVVNQRVAATFRKGRVLLAGDAAHLNSPIGGMGMNSGIHDAVNLAEKLIAIADGGDDDLLDLYSRQRKYVADTHVQHATKINKKNMEQRDPQSRQSYRDTMKRTADDPKLAKEFLMHSSLVVSLREAAQVT
jgi:3-(3-hydroxy-phenyl)propionate hydroxylase